MTYVVDTHALVWFLEGNTRLSTAGRNALTDRTAQMVIPTIVLAEIAFLYARHRIAIDLPRVLARVTGAANCPGLTSDVEAVRSVVRNRLSHAGMPTLTSHEVKLALETVRRPQRHNFKKSRQPAA